MSPTGRRTPYKDAPASDDDWFELATSLPDQWPSYSSAAFNVPGTIALFERIGIEWRWFYPYSADETRETYAPFWACVIHECAEGCRFAALRRALLCPEWRHAAMAVWRMTGSTQLNIWITQQYQAGALAGTTEQARRVRQQQKKEPTP